MVTEKEALSCCSHHPQNCWLKGPHPFPGPLSHLGWAAYSVQRAVWKEGAHVEAVPDLPGQEGSQYP